LPKAAHATRLQNSSVEDRAVQMTLAMLERIESMSAPLPHRAPVRDKKVVSSLVRSASSIIEEANKGAASDVRFVGWSLLGMALCLERWHPDADPAEPDAPRAHLSRWLRKLSCESAQVSRPEEKRDYLERALKLARAVLDGR